MRGGFLHNTLLVAGIETMLWPIATSIIREFPVRLPGDAVGAIDLFAIIGAHRIAVEVELTADRVPGDMAKAHSANANELLLIAPNAVARGALQRRVRRLTARTPPRLSVHVLTLPLARQYFETCFPFISTPIPTKNNNAASGQPRSNIEEVLP